MLPIKGFVNIESQDIRPYHPLLKRLTDISVQIFLPLCHLVKLRKGETLHERRSVIGGEGCAYLIAYGLVDLIDEDS